jgi:hypothetical protein
MKDLNNATLKELREILVAEIVKKNGSDYALGWLTSAYVLGHGPLDTDPSKVIAQILKERS